MIWMAAGEHLVQANVGELPETVSKWTYYMELIHIYIAPELGICQNMSDVNSHGAKSEHLPNRNEGLDLSHCSGEFISDSDCSIDPYWAVIHRT